VRLLLLLAVVLPRPAGAYLCTAVPNSSPQLSQAWVDRCLPYFISTDGTLLQGAQRRQLIAQSFGAWTQDACTDLVFMDLGYSTKDVGFNPSDTDNQNLIISIEDDGRAREFFTRNELAITLTSFNTATGEIFDADILFNNASFPFQDVADANACRALDPMPYDLRNTLIHEIGHFIGFEHDPNPESTMFASAPECETKKRTLTQDNKNGVCEVYASGQPVDTCAPPDTYDKGPGNPARFRDQCTRHLEEESPGCACRAAPGGFGGVAWLVLVVAAAIRCRPIGR
jgi:hypothetical protein